MLGCQDWFLSGSLNAQPTQLSHEIAEILSKNIAPATNGTNKTASKGINGINGIANAHTNGIAHEENGVVHVDQVKTREGEE